ncbi:MAG: (2Fe-2S)-binding protein [Galactobacter sp.]
MSKGLQQTPEVTLSVDGQQITAPEGATAAAAMLGAGQRAWRTTRQGGKPRGQFCGIGACWDCLVSVDGSQVQRACMLPVEEGMSISTVDPEQAAGPDTASNEEGER